MFIKSLKLDNFRNFEKVELGFEAKNGIQIFLGKNARGKTNLLESIFLLSFPKSFRVPSPNDLIRFGQNYYTIEAETSKCELMVGYQKKPIRRTYKKNGNEVPLQEYLTNLQTVLFTPEDVEVLNDSPSERRRLLDTILAQIDREYFTDLLHFTKILKQRNALLKNIRQKKSQRNELAYWNSEFAKTAERIHLKRQELIDYFCKDLNALYNEISEEKENKVELKYRFSGHSRMEQYNSYEEVVSDLLEQELSYEIEVGHTTVGPHRDDFSIILNDKDVSQFCSRGEKRSFVLVLKVIELKFLEFKSTNRPILLLDDVFSELDGARRTKLLEISNDYQTFISTVEQSYFKDFSGDVAVYNFDNNQVSRYN
jgi:DNA replication and repair protein RecF